MAAPRSNLVPFRTDTSRGDLDFHFGGGTGSASRESSPPSQERKEAASRATVVPRAIPLMDFGDSLRLRYPVFVVIEESDGAVIAASYDLEIAEYGDTEFEALERFRSAVVELYEASKEMGDEALPHLASKRRFLDALSI